MYLAPYLGEYVHMGLHGTTTETDLSECRITKVSPHCLEDLGMEQPHESTSQKERFPRLYM